MSYKRSGGKQCVVFGCTNNQKKLSELQKSMCKDHGMKHEDCPCLQHYKFHCIPKNEEMRRAWLKALNRKDFNPNSKSLVCSVHFADGRPTKRNPVPTLNMGYSAKEPTPGRRPLVRRTLTLNTPVKTELQSHVDNIDEEKLTATPLNVLDESFTETTTFSDQCISVCCHKYPEHCKNFIRPKLVDSSTQTIDIVSLDHNYWYSEKTRNASTQHTVPEFTVENIKTDTDSRFYTGLSLTVFMTLIATLSQYGKNLPYKLSVPDQILSVLVRLRLALSFRDIARRFDISHQLVGNIFHTWIDIMAQHLSACVVWLPRETIRRTLPVSFKSSFPRTTCIIDCSEIFIQRPFSLKARAQTWSTYKSNNTAKFLIAIAPNGFIMYVSPLYGGRASDNYITKNCGFLDFLLPGDEVMADRGFTIGEDLCARRVKLNIPAFMKGRDQLSEQETIESRRIASDRIHVERAIMRVKSYRLLNTKQNIKSLKKSNKTLSVIAALCNMRDSLIKDDESSD